MRVEGARDGEERRTREEEGQEDEEEETERGKERENVWAHVSARELVRGSTYTHMHTGAQFDSPASNVHAIPFHTHIIKSPKSREIARLEGRAHYARPPIHPTSYRIPIFPLYALFPARP